MDRIVKGPNLEFSTETHDELLYEEKRLSDGAEGEAEIAANIQAHYLYQCRPPPGGLQPQPPNKKAQASLQQKTSAFFKQPFLLITGAILRLHLLRNERLPPLLRILDN